MNACNPAQYGHTFRMHAAAAKMPKPDGAPAPEHRNVSARFGQRLRELRLQRGMTQLDMAIYFGIDRSFISDVERGRKSISLSLLEVIAIGFELTLADLLRDL